IIDPKTGEEKQVISVDDGIRPIMNLVDLAKTAEGLVVQKKAKANRELEATNAKPPQTATKAAGQHFTKKEESHIKKSFWELQNKEYIADEDLSPLAVEDLQQQNLYCLMFI
nr:hypothetical protein [Tanacetum cinerariifolium]